MDGPSGGYTRRLTSRKDLFCHHCGPVPNWLVGTDQGSAEQIHLPPGRGLCGIGPVGWCQRAAGHFQPHDTLVYESHHCLFDLINTWNDFGGNIALRLTWDWGLDRRRSAGSVTAAGPEREDNCLDSRGC